MVYNSNGGFNWSDLYFMPTKLREFYWRELLKIKDGERDRHDKAMASARNKNTPAPSKTSRRWYLY